MLLYNIFDFLDNQCYDYFFCISGCILVKAILFYIFCGENISKIMKSTPVKTNVKKLICVHLLNRKVVIKFMLSVERDSWRVTNGFLDCVFGINNLTRQQGDQIGRFFAYWASVFYGSFFDNCRSSPIFWPLFTTEKVINLTNNVLGYILGHFFTNSSGHTSRKLVDTTTCR
jgi:hypothetical protein